MKVKRGIYKHFKGFTCKVIGVGKHSETHEDLVFYEHEYSGTNLWARPVEMFLEEVEVEGEKVPRFQFISGVEQQE